MTARSSTARADPTPQVVAAANRLMSGPGVAIGPTLIGQRPDGPEPVGVSYPDERAELHGHCTDVQALIEAGTPPSEIAVLHRFDFQAAAITAALHDAQLPVARGDNDDFWSRPEIVRTLQALELAAADAPDGPGLASLDAALAQSGWTPETAPPAGPGAVRARWENQAALGGIAGELPVATALDAAALHAALRSRAARDTIPIGTRGISVLTIHKAKGLERDAVLLPRLTHGSLPASYATTPEQQAEERRLAYVAVTRARVHLRLSHATTWGPHDKPARVSPYVVRILPPSVTSPRATASTVRPLPTSMYTLGMRVVHLDKGLGTVMYVTHVTCGSSRDVTDHHLELRRDLLCVGQYSRIRRDHGVRAVCVCGGAVGVHHDGRVHGASESVHLDLDTKSFSRALRDHVEAHVVGRRGQACLPTLPREDGRNMRFVILRTRPAARASMPEARLAFAS